MTDKNFTPFPVLHTERLALRQLLDSDDREIFALRSNDSVNKYLGRKPSESLADAKSFIQAIQENTRQNNSIYWAITLTGTDQLIGTICLFDFSDYRKKAEIGYELLPAFQGKGLMQEAVSEVIRFAVQQLGLTTIEACSHCDNIRSTNILQRLNFKKHGAVDDNLLLFQLTHTG